MQPWAAFSRSICFLFQFAASLIHCGSFPNTLHMFTVLNVNQPIKSLGFTNICSKQFKILLAKQAKRKLTHPHSLKLAGKHMQMFASGLCSSVQMLTNVCKCSPVTSLNCPTVLVSCLPNMYTFLAVPQCGLLHPC